MGTATSERFSGPALSRPERDTPGGSFPTPLHANLQGPMEPDNGTGSTAYPLIGQVVGGRYHIVGLIGEGGMGIVYKAEQRLGSTVRKVAVKTLHAELSRDPSITARFHREVGTVAQLEHPNTVKVYDFGSTDDGTLYIAMEFLDGRSLSKVIETEGALEPRRVGNLIRQVAGSLDEAHRQGIVHRALKPENVLLIDRAGEKDVVKLVDFGIAARTESADREKEQKLTQQGMVLGTPPYMSPEQFTGKHLDARSDVYSLGIMAYEMLTGQLPFQADTPWQWATHHMTSPPRSFDEIPAGARIPEALRRTVLKALSKEPHDRQSTAGQFYSELNAGLSGFTSAAPQPVLPRGKTEAMPQAAAFAMSATEAMPATPGIAARSPAVASPPVALPPAPPRETSSGGRGLVYGLSAVGAVLLVAMGVVALGNGGGDDPAPPLDLTLSNAGETAGVSPTAPVVPEEPTLEPDPPKTGPSPGETKPSATKPSGTTKPAAKPAPSTPAGTTPTATTPPATVPTPPVTAPPVQPPPVVAPPVVQPQPAPTPPVAAAGDPCRACVQAVDDGRFAAAVQAFGPCNDKKKCTVRMGQAAPRAAITLARNQKCDEARRVVQAARAMNVPDGPLLKADAAIAECK